MASETIEINYGKIDDEILLSMGEDVFSRLWYSIYEEHKRRDALTIRGKLGMDSETFAKAQHALFELRLAGELHESKFAEIYKYADSRWWETLTLSPRMMVVISIGFKEFSIEHDVKWFRVQQESEKHKEQIREISGQSHFREHLEPYLENK